jgi:diacylglycerol kinase (ATP)
MAEKIHIIVNPASGGRAPDHVALQNTLESCDVDWRLSETTGAGDGREIAKRAVEEGADIVVAYGGDGTVAEVASALVGTTAALGIVPGGTANVVALELGIPTDLSDALHLVCGRRSKYDKMDVGQIGDHHFLLRVGIGYEARMITQADRKQKDRLGFAAYLWSGLKNLVETDVANYRFVIDGHEVECQGFTCAIANSGSLGLPGLKLGQAVTMYDGMLDVVVLEKLHLRSLVDLLGEVTGYGSMTANAQGATMDDYSADIEAMLQHWQGAEIEVSMDPMQVVQYDGERLDPVDLPLKIKVLAKQLNIIVPE